MCLLERQRTEEGREHESVGWGNRNIGRGKDSMDGSGGEKRKVKQADVFSNGSECLLEITAQRRENPMR